jgi:hypothetical protein
MIRLMTLIILSLYVITGCGGSSGSSVNLKVTQIEEPKDAANSGHTVDIEYILHSDALAQNVAINFYIIHKAQFDADIDGATDPNFEQYYIGTDEIEVTLVGENKRIVEFILPASITTSGDYFIVAEVDPGNTVAESNEDDNLFYSHETTTRSTPVYMDVNTAYATTKNLMVRYIELESNSLVINQNDIDATGPDSVDMTEEYPNHGVSHISGEAAVLVFGGLLTEHETNNITVRAQINISDTWHDLYIWDNKASKYSDSTTIASFAATELVEEINQLEEDFAYHIPFDVNVPASVASLISTELKNEASGSNLMDGNLFFTLRLIVDTDNHLTEITEYDNYAETQLKAYTGLVKKRKANDGLLEKSYTKGVGKKSKARVEIDLYSKNGLETSGKYGAIMQNEFSINGYALNHSRSIFSAKQKYSAYVNNPGNTGYMHEVDVFGFTLYGEEEWMDTITLSTSPSWNKQKVLGTAQVFIGPVPVDIETGLTGSVAFDLSTTLSVDDTKPLISTTDKIPNLNMDLYGSAGVGIKGFSAGIIVDMLLLSEAIVFDAAANVSYDKTADSLLSGDVGLKISNDIKSIAGKFGLYATYPTTKHCKVLGKSVPCGVKSKTKYKYFYKTDSLYDKKFKLYDYSDTWSL